MQQFYLVFITNAMIGLAIGFLWGLTVGYRAGLGDALRSPTRPVEARKHRRRTRTALKAKNGSESLTDPPKRATDKLTKLLTKGVNKNGRV